VLSSSCAKGLGRCPAPLCPSLSRPSPAGTTQTCACLRTYSPGGHAKGEGARERSRDAVREGIVNEEGQRALLSSLFLPPHPRHEPNPFILGGEVTPALRLLASGLNVLFRFVSSEKYFPFNPKSFMETKMSSLPDVSPLLVT